MFAAANHGITVILSFVNRTVFIRLLGVDYLGINGLFADILMMLSLADLGLTSAMAYSYYKPIAEHDTEKVAALLQYYKKIYQYIAASVAFWVWPLCRFWISWSGSAGRFRI